MLHNQRHLVQIPSEVSYLNCAYMSPLLEKIALAGKEGVDRKGLPYLIKPIDFFNDVNRLKKVFSRIINCKEYQRIAITPSISYSIANAAHNVTIKPGQEILLVDEIFPSNYYCWERVCREKGGQIKFIKPSEKKERGRHWNEKILESINSKTAAINLGHIHWTDGTLFDLAAIRQKTKEVGAAMIVDASQSLGALEFDLEKLEVDAVFAVGYKWLFGPYGISLAYYGPYFDQGLPIEESWMNRKDSEDFSQLMNYQDQYQPMAGRYSVGQNANFVNIPMMIAALEQLEEWGVENIQAYAKKLSGAFIPQLEKMGCQTEDEAWRSSHLLGIRFSEETFDKDQLKQEFDKRNIYISLRGSAVRVSTHLYNTEEDWEKLVDAFRASKR